MSAKETRDITDLVPASKGTTTLDRLRSGKARDLLNMSYDDLLKTLTAEDELVSASMAGDGFIKPPEKNAVVKGRLVGVPLIIVDWRSSPGRFGKMYSLRVVTKNNERLVIVDGSTGIAAQMDAVVKSGYTGAIGCPNGLRVSRYPVIDYGDRGDATQCSACQGLRMIDPDSDPENREPGKQICQACQGQGWELLRDANGNVMEGETFYLDTSGES